VSALDILLRPFLQVANDLQVNAPRCVVCPSVVCTLVTHGVCPSCATWEVSLPICVLTILGYIVLSVNPFRVVCVIVMSICLEPLRHHVSMMPGWTYADTL